MNMRKIKKIITLMLLLSLLIASPTIVLAMSGSSGNTSLEQVVEKAKAQPLQSLNARKDYYDYYLPVGFKRLNSTDNGMLLVFNDRQYIVNIDLAQAYREFLAIRANEINEFNRANADVNRLEEIEVIDPFSNFYATPSFTSDMIVFEQTGVTKAHASDEKPYTLHVIRATPDSNQLVVRLRIGSVTVQAVTTYELLNSTIEDMMLIGRNVLVDVREIAINEFQYSIRANFNPGNMPSDMIPTDGYITDLSDPSNVDGRDLSSEIDLLEEELERANQSENNEQPENDQDSSATR